VIGPSGCGKSTLLNMTAGLMAPSGGAVTYRGESISGVNTRVGYVTQKDDLLPWRTVLANVMLPLELRGYPRDSRAELAQSMVTQVGLDGFARHYPAQLSGGMQKRVNLARTLVYEPEMLLLDEPFSALDAQLRLVLQQDLLGLLEKSRKTVLLVTHDLGEAVALADRVVVMAAKPGRILTIERVEHERPRNLEAEQFSPASAEIQKRLWSYLRREVQKATGI
jgi:NitT/TauT family transport system ATP-binding protein